MSSSEAGLLIREYLDKVDSKIKEIGGRKGLTWSRVEERIGGKRPVYAVFSPIKVPWLTPARGVLVVIYKDIGSETNHYPNIIVDATRTLRPTRLRVYAVIVSDQVTSSLRQLLDLPTQVGVFRKKMIEFCLVDKDLSLHLPDRPYPDGAYDVFSPEELRYILTP